MITTTGLLLLLVVDDVVARCPCYACPYLLGSVCMWLLFTLKLYPVTAVVGC